MNIHPLWFLCITVRLSMILLIKKLYAKKETHIYIKLFLLFIALGFLYKALTGSNNEKQVNKVFWHDTRIIHFVFYSLSTFLLIQNKLDLALIILFIDVIFSITYRVVMNK